jgi:HPt (histidine-containing phosphotransfer) domain-containing protein
MSGEDVIDHAVLKDLLETTGGDAIFLGDLLDTYFEDSPELLAAMRRAQSAGDAEGLRRAAHSLKSSSANFGALTLAKLCREVEDGARAGAPQGADGQVAQVEAEYERVRHALLGMRQGGWLES